MRKFTKFFLSLMAMLMVTVSANAWKFTLLSPTEGEVTSLDEIKIQAPGAVAEWTAVPIPVKKDGAEFKNWNMADDWSFTNTIVGRAADYAAAEDPGVYTMEIPAGAYHIGADGNEAQTFTWTIKGDEPEPEASPYTLTYDGEFLKLVKDGATSYDVTYAGGATLEGGYDGYFSFNPADPEWTFMGNTCIGAYVSLAPGDYILHVQANTYLFDGVANEAFDIPFTVGGGTQGGGGGGTFEGEPFHETIFEAGVTAVSIPYTVDNTNVSISTVGRPFLDTTIDVGYNMNSEKELNWKNGTKFVITAKTDINKVIFVPTTDSKNAIANASADKGTYTNGVWEGKLAAGETLTLTANDGINIKEFYICYNGDDFDPIAGGSEEKGEITIQYPVENQLIEKQVDGGKFCVFTTNKEYAYVTIQVVNSNPVYDNLDGFPVRMVDNMGENSDNLHVGENTIYAATPASGSAGKGDDWYWFKDDSYTMIVKGYVNPWDNAEDYDAIAEVHFVGNGKEHVAESTTKLINVTPASGSQIAMVNGVVTLEFDGPVSSVTALTPGGQSDPTINYVATAKAGSDNKVWEINLGDRSGYASADTDGNPILEVDVTAKAADGIVLLSDTRADRGLELKYELVNNAGPSTAVTLGSPVWSVAENAEIEASTSSINIKFPDATNVEGTYTLEVAGTIGDKQFNLSNVSGTGTMANGADIAVSLSEDKGYNLHIGTITIKDGETVVYATDMGNFQLNFGTKAAQGGGTGDNILGEPTFTATADGIVVEWPNAQVSDINECYISLGEWTLTHKGVDYTTYPDAIEDFTNGVKVEIPYTKVAAWDDVNYVYIPVEVNPGDEINISIAAEGINVYENYYSSFDPAIYTNAEPITGTVTVPSDEPQPTSVVLYEKDVNPEVAASKEGDSQRDLVIEGTDVTLTISNTSTSSMGKWINNAYIDNNRGGIVTTNTNVMKFTSSRTIEKIEFTANKTITQKNGTSCVGTLADNVWTGEASEISIAIGENVTNISKIVVYFKSETPKVKATMSIGAAKWGTFVAPFEVTIPAGVTAYKVTGRNEGVLDLEEVDTTIPANTPVVVYSESQVAEDFEGVAVDGTPQAGMLVGVYDETQVEVGTYVLQNHDGVVGFYKVGPNSNNTVKANRCYLVDSSNARAAYFFTEEDATAINGINADVLGAEGIYNASGVRVNSLQKGLNIIKTANGTKKVMIK